MKQNLLHAVVGIALAMFTTSALAQDVTENVSVTSDVTLAYNKEQANTADQAMSDRAAIEMYTLFDADNTLKREYIGLMSFQLPVKSGYSVKSATLRLVTERAKGTMAIYAFGADVSNNDTYNSQKENVDNARQNAPLALTTLKGTSGKATFDNGASTNMQDWVNVIDLTAYAQKKIDGKVNLLLVNNAESTGTSIQVYASEAEKQIKNGKATSPKFTYNEGDLLPLLTVVYEKNEDVKSNVLDPTADTWVYKGNTGSFGSDRAIELSYEEQEGKDPKEIDALMSFQLPTLALSSDYTIKSATLRLVSERVKGDRNVNIYGYEAFDETTNYAGEEAKIAAAKTAGNLITTFAAKGSNKAMPYDELPEAYKTVDAWVNEIDLTDYIKGQGKADVHLLLTKAKSSTESVKFYSKDLAEDIVNGKDNSLVFKKEDLLPHLTIVYEKNFHELAVTAAEAATLVLPYDATIPENVKVYTLSYSGGGKAIATEVKDVLPANTPVLVNAPEGNYQFVKTGNGSKADSPVKDGLVGVWEETTAPAGTYVLQNKNGNVAFYKVEEGSIIKVKANQAYLQLAQSIADSKLQSISIDFGGTNGIHVIDSEKSGREDAIYTLSGMRVDKNHLNKNQIYICNGKAFVVK